jgi:uncharacterized membrane protein YcaP (DUF421 family)
MNKYKIHFNDINRILQGEVPMSFYIEIVIRSLVIYLILVIALRLMAKRISLRLNRTELGALSTIAAAAGAALQAPERGLLPVFIVVGMVILMQRLTNKLSAKSQRVEELLLGRIGTLVHDGHLHLKDMADAKISRERLFAELRSNQLTNLGQVQRLYMEANGSFTLIKRDGKRSGLSVLPSWDEAFIKEQEKDQDKTVCTYCGFEQQNTNNHECPNCKKSQWTKASF